MRHTKKLTLAALMALAAFPAFSAERLWLEPYIAMRASYMFLEPEGRQSVYLAPGGIVGAKIADEELNIDSDRAFGVKLAFGGDADLPWILSRVRIEAEYANNGRFSTPISSGGGNAIFEAQSTALFGNAYYYLNAGTMVSPYIGAGLGLSHFTGSGNFANGSFNGQMSKSEYTLGWQAGAGLGIHLGRGISVDVGYRYSDLGEFKGGVDISQFTASGANVLNSVVLHNDVNIRFRAHEIMLGVRYML